MNWSLSRLIPVALRHLDAYAEIAGEDARDAVTVLTGRLLAVLLAAASAMISALMACAWLLALTWDGPWRTWTVAGLAIAFAAAAAGIAFNLRRRRSGQRSLLFTRVRREWHRDRDLFERVLESETGNNHAAG